MQTKNTYINLCVADVEKSISFFRELGFEFDDTYTNGIAGCIKLNASSYVMLLCPEHFQVFTPKAISDAKATTETLIALQLNTRGEVSRLCESAFAAGGRKYKEPEEVPPMFGWGFEDLDGHIWECFYNEPEKESAEPTPLK
jgi:predicted lactoylglutathione lyase